MVYKTVEKSIETDKEMTVMTEAETGLETDHFSEIMATILEIEVQATVGPGPDPEQVQIGIEFNNCGEYGHFTRDCPTSREEKEIEQLQQMLNLGDEQTSLTPLMSNTQDKFL